MATEGGEDEEGEQVDPHKTAAQTKRSPILACIARHALSLDGLLYNVLPIDGTGIDVGISLTVLGLV